jgi:TonB family protein
VTSFGYPRKIRVKQSSGFEDLDNAATEAAAGWHYVPAVIDGDTATAWTTVKIHFELPQQAAAAAPALPTDEREINDHCTRPTAPGPVDGAVATGAEMASAHDALQRFIASSDRYQTCLRLYIGAQENLTFSVHTTVPAWVYKGIDKKVAENQKDKQAAGDNYNEAVAKFKTKTPH